MAFIRVQNLVIFFEDKEFLKAMLGKKNFVQKTSLAFHNGISKLQISRASVIMHKINGDFFRYS